MIATNTRVPTVILTSSCYDEAEIDFNHMSLLDLEHSGKLCEDLIIHGSNYGFVGAWTALCCSVFAAIAIVAHFNVLHLQRH